MNGTNPSKDDILETCERINRKGQAYMVHKYKYCEQEKRNNLFLLKYEGKLMQCDAEKPFLAFYLPKHRDKFQ